MPRKLISIVVPAFNETECVEELGRRLKGVFAELPHYDFEAIIVENGSVDDTMEKLERVREGDERFKILQLARNFRMDGGLTAGLAFARGDAVILMTADLQDPPEMIPRFVAKWEEGYDHVYGVVTKRQGTGPVRKLNSALFYAIAGRMTDGRIPRNVSDFRLISRRMAEVVNELDERNRFMRGLFAWVGFRSIGVEHERALRHGGKSQAYTFPVIGLAVRGILAHSYVPLRIITFVGLALSLLSVVALFALTARFVFAGVPFPGFGTIVCVMILLFGFLFSMLGIVSEYVGLIYEEVKRRPNFVVRQAVGLEDRDPHGASPRQVGAGQAVERT